LYDRFIDDTESSAVTALQEELDARNAEYQELKLKLDDLNKPNLEGKV
jgi:hypothetical protein